MSHDEGWPFRYFEIPAMGTKYLLGLKYADGELIIGGGRHDEEDVYRSTEGVQPIRACFVLKKSLVGKPQLNFIKYVRIQNASDLHAFNEQYGNDLICTIPKMPENLPEDEVIELPSETRNGETLGLVLVDLKTQDESLVSRRTFRFADYSLPVKAAMNARKDIIDPHLGPDPQVVPSP
jgi:hypothetical protein